VGIKEAPPFVIRAGDEAWGGLAVELWEEIAEIHDLDFEYVPYDLESLLNAVERSEVDLAIGALTMTAARERRFDFSHAYYISGLGIAVKRDKARGWLAALGRFFSWRFVQVVAALTALLLGSGFLVWLFERRKNPQMFGGRSHSGIGSGFWWAAVTMTTVGYGDKAPLTTGGRTVALFWMFASLIMISGFTAAIASALTVGALASTIRGPEDLIGSRIVSIAGSSSEEWLHGRGIGFIPVPTVEEGLTALRDGNADAMIYDAPILDYRVRNDPNGNLLVLPERFELQPYAFALPTDSPLTELLNREVLAITTADAWRQHVMDVLGREP
jgi:ABC-type amino acid transport substrate-binding protein